MEASRDTADLDETARALSAITTELTRAYAALEQRARRVEVELEHTNRALSAILEALPTGVVVRDADGRVVRANRAAEELLGAPAAALEDDPNLAALDAALGRTTTVRTPGRAPRRLFARGATVVGPEDETLGSLVIVDDRTELERLNAQLLVRDKMAALGTLAAGVAHEIRNPLNAIAGFAALLERGLDDERLERWASLIAAGAAEIDGIVTGLVTMAGPEQLVTATLDARALVDGALEQVRAHRTDDGRTRIETAIEVERLVGDAIKLRQALRNLVDNALRVQPEGGRVRVRVTADGDDVVLTVEDDGPGVPDELRTRVLEPFFTTRPEGTGLGLALTHTIAQLHGGVVEVDDATPPLGGAAFRIRIPRTPTGRPE